MYLNLNRYKDNRPTCTKMYSVVQHPDNSLVLGVDVEKAPPPEEFVPQPLWLLVCMRLMFLLQFALIFQTFLTKPIYPVIIVRMGHTVLTSTVWIINEIEDIHLNKKMAVIYVLAACQLLMVVIILTMLLDLYLLLVIFIYAIIFSLLFGTR